MELLLKGDAQILGYDATAQMRWEEILNSDDADERETLEVRLVSEPSWYDGGDRVRPAFPLAIARSFHKGPGP